MEDAFDQFKPELMRHEMGTTWKGRMKEKTDIGLLKVLLDVEWHHQQVVVLEPNGGNAFDLVLHFQDLLGYFQVDGLVVLPVLEIILPQMLDVSEVIKQRSNNSFVIN